MSTYRKTPFPSGERIAHWTLLEPVLPPPRRLTEYVYWARPDCCGVARQVNYRSLMLWASARKRTGLCVDCSDRYRSQHRMNPPAFYLRPEHEVQALNVSDWVCRLPVSASLARNVWGHPCLSS